MRPWAQRLVSFGLSVLLVFLVLEAALRLGGAWFRHRNQVGRGPADGIRILCLGESTTACGGQNSWPAQLQELLDRIDPGRPHVVLNGGIPGSGTTLIVREAQRHLEEFEPHIVVTMMGANDGGDFSPNLGAVAADSTGIYQTVRTARLIRLLWYQLGGAQIAAVPTIGRPGNVGIPIVEGAPGYPHDLPGILARQGRTIEAEALLREAVEAAPNDYRGWVSLARFLDDQGRVGDAEAACRVAVQLDGTRVEALVLLARLRHAGGDREGAVLLLDRAIGLGAPGVHDLSDLYRVFKENRADEACALATLSHDLDPQNVPLVVAVAECAEREGRLDDAEALLLSGPRGPIGAPGEWSAQTLLAAKPPPEMAMALPT